MIAVTFKNFAMIHEANYSDNDAASELFAAIAEKVESRANAVVHNLPEFFDYCDVTED